MWQYHERVPSHAATASEHSDAEILREINRYIVGTRDRVYLTGSGGKGIDHREWRRANIREAFNRGLISKDPGDAP